MRIACFAASALLVSGATACSPPLPVLGDVSLAVDLVIDGADADGGTAFIRGSFDRLDGCGRRGDLVVSINDVLAEPLVASVAPPEAVQCPGRFGLELPYLDDGVTESLRVSALFASEVADEFVEVNVFDGLPHRFVDLTLDNDDDVLTRGSRHEFEVRPALAGEHTATVSLQRAQPMPPVVGTWVTPSSFEYAVSATIAGGSGVLEVEIENAAGSQPCTIDDGRSCTIDITTRASRRVQIASP